MKTLEVIYFIINGFVYGVAVFYILKELIVYFRRDANKEYNKEIKKLLKDHMKYQEEINKRLKENS